MKAINHNIVKGVVGILCALAPVISIRAADCPKEKHTWETCPCLPGAPPQVPCAATGTAACTVYTSVVDACFVGPSENYTYVVETGTINASSLVQNGTCNGSGVCVNLVTVGTCSLEGNRVYDTENCENIGS
jgi:hypothetical protein